ncbi:nicotinate (nicotinamide) nucleotide adenylyltransferase [Geothrix sp. PMB-07]|uniref:nicotinate (nicotinamide) nucleotide adenylyltransferase n=1 Tax=Geothrix sp. PMB-07 TaxID=3068640 RepID=UPI002740C5DF|nr:nicotinate (nicotinamide) nucleotide adenylyltransferase [Geothrix sp. PMB-07]WLT31417.1 nicotinate (nicotinamide) nucleotide adenylyltransferase [Geothrix sp. PMB-07]
MRIGLLGGAFNPPHEGHLRLAHLALEHLALDELRFVPTALSPHKPDPGGPGPEARLRLLAEALLGLDPRCRVEPLEIQRGGTSYTVDTLETLVEREPGQSWILVMGSDQLPGLPAWRRPERIFQLASAAVALRPGAPFDVPMVPGLQARPTWSGSPGELVALPATELDLASTDLRSRLQALPEEAPAGLPPQVLRTIRTENLYR